MKILSVDFGTKKIGLAFSTGYLAEPLMTLNFINHQKTAAAIAKIIQERQINKVVMGVSEGKLKEKSQLLAQEIRKAVNVPVILYDETLTSVEARKKLKEAKKSWWKRKQQEHEFAAAIILQEYLDCHNNNC